MLESPEVFVSGDGLRKRVLVHHRSHLDPIFTYRWLKQGRVGNSTPWLDAITPDPVA